MSVDELERLGAKKLTGGRRRILCLRLMNLNDPARAGMSNASAMRGGVFFTFVSIKAGALRPLAHLITWPNRGQRERE